MQQYPPFSFDTLLSDKDMHSSECAILYFRNKITT